MMTIMRTDDERWAAVLRRDAGFDGRFYYSVCSTGVYCRPSCGARTPRRENVRFHESAAEALAAGFRACKRCRPDEPPLAQQHAGRIAEACRLVERSDEMPNLDALAAAVGLSRYHFHRLFKSHTGLTPRAYADAYRASRMRDELRTSDTVTHAIYGAGYNSSGRFYAASAQVLGMVPTQYRAGGEGAAIRFAMGQSSLGAILVAATARGLCAIALGDDPQVLIDDLQRRFPKAQLIGGDAEFERWVATVVGFVEAPRIGLDLPLDVRGTAFQQRVWQALRQIPMGSTATYRDIAQQLGVPQAVRAVAQACAANPLAVAIPCHRVVRQDGGLSGYRWGVERKRALLEREAST